MAVEQDQGNQMFSFSTELSIDGMSILSLSRFSCGERIQNSVMRLFHDLESCTDGSVQPSTRPKCVGPSHDWTSMVVRVEVMKEQ